MNILAMHPLHVLAYLMIFSFLCVIVVIIVSYLKTIKKRKQEYERIKPVVKYIKEGLKKGYTPEQLVNNLLLNGWSLLDCNRALKKLKKKPV